MDLRDIGLIILLIGLLVIPFLIELIPSMIGNKDAFDLNYSFDKAIIWVGEEKIELDIKSWKDYEGDQIQIKAADGKVYLVSSLNTILIGE